MYAHMNHLLKVFLCCFLTIWAGIAIPVMADPPEDVSLTTACGAWTPFDVSQESDYELLFQSLFNVEDSWMDEVDARGQPNFSLQEYYWPLDAMINGPGGYTGATRHGFPYVLTVELAEEVVLHAAVLGSVEQNQMIQDLYDQVAAGDFTQAEADAMVADLQANSWTEEEYQQFVAADQVVQWRFAGILSTEYASIHFLGVATHGVPHRASRPEDVTYFQILQVVGPCSGIFLEEPPLPGEEPAPGEGEQGAQSGDPDYGVKAERGPTIIISMEPGDCDDCYDQAAADENEAWDDYNDEVDDAEEDYQDQVVELEEQRDAQINLAVRQMQTQMKWALIQYAATMAVCGALLFVGPWWGLACAAGAAVAVAVQLGSIAETFENARNAIMQQFNEDQAELWAQLQQRVNAAWNQLQQQLAAIRAALCECVSALGCMCDGNSVPCSEVLDCPDSDSGAGSYP